MANFWEILNPGVEQYNPPKYATVNIPSPPPNPPQPGSPEWQAQQAVASRAVLPQPAPTPQALPQPMPSPQPAPQPQAAPQQAVPPQVAPPPERVSAWKGFLDSMKDPNVIGPLQTFLSAVAVPLRPGENLGARIGYASTLMQMHKRMLEENAVNEPLRRRKQEAEIKQAEATARETTSRADYNERSLETRLDKLTQELENAQDQASINRIKIEAETLKLDLENKYGEQEAKLRLRELEQKIRESQARAGMYNRSPKAGGAGGKETTTDADYQSILSDYDTLFGAPYEAAKRADPTLTFESWVKSSGMGPNFRKFEARVQAYNKGKKPEQQVRWGTTRYMDGERTAPGSKGKTRMTAEEYLKQ